MTTVAVVAHTGKTLDGGLDRAPRGPRPRRASTPRSGTRCPRARRRRPRSQEAVDDGADLVFVWGGDGMVQRCIDALRDPGVAVAILPAGTANLLATEPRHPRRTSTRPWPSGCTVGAGPRRRRDQRRAVRGDGRHRLRRPHDPRRRPGAEGPGGPARLRLDRRPQPPRPAGSAMTIRGRRRPRGSTGEASCVLVGNVGTVIGGLPAFPDAAPDDGVLEVGRGHRGRRAASGPGCSARLAAGRPDRSPLDPDHRRARRSTCDLDEKLPYELDGGDRKKTKHLKIGVEPGGDHRLRARGGDR